MIGFIGVAGLIAVAFWWQSVWFGILAAFILMNCWSGLKQARVLLRLGKLPRREGFACPSCKTAPLIGAFWKCSKCEQPFDTFQTRAVCPNCATRFPTTRCMDCGALNPMDRWIVSTSEPVSSSWFCGHLLPTATRGRMRRRGALHTLIRHAGMTVDEFQGRL